MTVELQWLGHASFRVSHGSTVVYIDPWKLSDAPQDATAVLVSHSHYDHYSPDDIAAVSNPETVLIAPEDVARSERNAKATRPGQTVELPGVSVTAVASYNIDKQFHPKANNWVGFVVNIAGLRIYYAGDTDFIEEMKALGHIDVALLPVGGTYTMDAEQASAAAQAIRPARAVPYHWGDIVGRAEDAARFAEQAGCDVTVLEPNQTIRFPT